MEYQSDCFQNVLKAIDENIIRKNLQKTAHFYNPSKSKKQMKLNKKIESSENSNMNQSENQSSSLKWKRKLVIQLELQE